MAFSRSPRRTLAAGLSAATVVLVSCLQTGPAGARPAGDAAVGIGCATGAGGVKKALTERMTSNVDYHGARQATLSAAADLYGQDSAQYRTVGAAWTAVNVK